MKHKRSTLKILLEDEHDFEKSLKYLGAGTLETDAKDFADRYAGSDQEKEDFMGLVNSIEDRLSNDAQGLLDMFDDLEKYGKTTTDKIQKATNEVEFFDAYIEAVKKAKKNPQAYVDTANSIKKFFSTTLLDPPDIDKIRNFKDTFGTDINIGNRPILFGISELGQPPGETNPRHIFAKAPWFGEDMFTDNEVLGIKNEDIPVDTQAPIEDQVQQFDDQLDDLEADMADFDAKLEKAVEENPPPDDDHDAFLKSLKKFQKYHDFLIKRLYKKIGEYAISKKRKDIVLLASKNVTTLNKWKDTLQTSMEDAWNEVIKTPEGKAGNKLQQITVGSFKPVIDIYDQATKDLASVIKTVKSDPLKELNAEKLTEGLRKQQTMLFERRCVRISKHVILLGD